ncbi:MAG: DUF2849 domain-containing protein [Sphingopyxis sp.]
MKLLSGNDLKSGAVIWWTGNGWSIHLADAADVSEGGDVIAAAEEAARRVNAPYIIDADAAGLPLHIKDRVRATGPSVRPDLALKPANEWAAGDV